MPKANKNHIAILGAGPIGIEAALYAQQLGFTVDVYDRGHVGHHLQQWGHVRLFSPFAMNVTPVGIKTLRSHSAQLDLPDDNDCITGREHLKCYLQPLAKCPELCDSIHTQTTIVCIGKRGLLKREAVGDRARDDRPFQILYVDANNQECLAEADIVLDCTGTYGNHCWIGNGGIPALGERSAAKNIAYTLEEVLGKQKERYAGKTIMVIGAGYSAATTVCQLAELSEQNPDTWVIWLARGKKSQPIPRITNDPLKERDRLAQKANTLATRLDSSVEFHPNTIVETVNFLGKDEGFSVTAKTGSQKKTWDVEAVIANVGYTPNTNLYRELHVHECYATLGPMKLAATLMKNANADCLQQSCPAGDTLRNPEPNFYIIGAKSYGRNSQFLMRIGFEQIREVFKLITQKANLNLYNKA